jgi:hypothetical protein
MSEKDSKSFLEWYKNQEDIFDFQFELKSYCESDVYILKRGCLTFRDIVMEISKSPKIDNDNGIDPFKECMTLPSLCHLVFRRNFMESKSLALINDFGFDPTQNFSNKQMLWLKYLSAKENIQIQHCFNGKEKRFNNYTVD